MKWVLAQVNLLLDNLIKRGRAMVSRCVLHKPGGGGGGGGVCGELLLHQLVKRKIWRSLFYCFWYSLDHPDDSDGITHGMDWLSVVRESS